MIEWGLLALAAGAVGWIIRGRQQQRAVAAAGGQEVTVPCMCRTGSTGWRRGRLRITSAGAVWEPDRAGAAEVPVTWGPGDLHIRGVGLLDWFWINPRSRVVEWDSSDVKLAVVPEDAATVYRALLREPG